MTDWIRIAGISNKTLFYNFIEVDFMDNQIPNVYSIYSHKTDDDINYYCYILYRTFGYSELLLDITKFIEQIKDMLRDSRISCIIIKTDQNEHKLDIGLNDPVIAELSKYIVH